MAIDLVDRHGVEDDLRRHGECRERERETDTHLRETDRERGRRAREPNKRKQSYVCVSKP